MRLADRRHLNFLIRFVVEFPATLIEEKLQNRPVSIRTHQHHVRLPITIHITKRRAGRALTKPDDNVAASLAVWQKWFIQRYPDEPEPKLPVDSAQNNWTYQELLSHLSGPAASQADPIRDRHAGVSLWSGYTLPPAGPGVHLIQIDAPTILIVAAH